MKHWTHQQEQRIALCNSSVAIKNTLNIFDTPTDALRALREISILRQCKHPNICKIIDVLQPKNTRSFSDLWIVMV